MTDPVDFVVKKLPYDLSSHGGLALVGRLFKRINLAAVIDPKYPVRGGIANSDILKCYLGLLTPIHRTEAGKIRRSLILFVLFFDWLVLCPNTVILHGIS